MTRLLLLALAALLAPAALAPAALAQTCTTSWTNPDGGVWEIVTNWSDGIPDVLDTACITLPGTYTVSQIQVDIAVRGLVVGGASGTQTLKTKSAFIISGDAAVLPNARWEFLSYRTADAGIRMNGLFSLGGTLTIPRGVSFLRTGGTLDVAPGGTLRVVGSNSPLAVGSAAGAFRIRGLLEATDCPATPSSGTCQVDAPLDVQGGTVRAAGGVLFTRAGGTLAGATLDAAAGASLYLRNDAAPTVPYIVTGTLSGAPAGMIFANGANLAAGVGGATLAIGGTGLQLGGLTNTTFLTSAGGSFVNTGLIVRPASVSNFSGLREVILRNRGVIALPTGLGLYAGSLLVNEPTGVIRATGNGRLSGNATGTGRFENEGLFELDAPGATFGFGDGGSGQNSGPYSRPGSEIRVLRGRLELPGPGSRNLPDGVSLTGSGTVGTGTTFSPEGTVSPGTADQLPATLTISGYFSPSLVSGSPRLVIDVDAGGLSDRLDVLTGPGSRQTRLAGVLIVRVRPGYVPTIGDAFTILTSASAIEGQFAAVVGLDAPSGIAFVTEVSADGRSLVLRAVAVAPGGPVTVSTTAPVGGGIRPIFLTGPGSEGISAARLECTDCLDAAAFGTIPAQIVGPVALREARFDLTSPRAFGFYDLVLVRPGQPEERIPVTVRPYLAYVVASGGTVLGIRVRPAGYNVSTYPMSVRSNSGAAAFALPRIVRSDAPLVSVQITPTNLAGAPFETDATPEPTRAPLAVGRLVPGRTTALRVGLRIDPADVLFPEQTPTGPGDPRVPFGEPRLTTVAGAQHLSAERAVAIVAEALRTSGNAALTAYVAQVEAADPTAIASSFAAISTSETFFGPSRLVLDGLISGLGQTVAAPAGLAAASADGFDRALERVSAERYRAISAAFTEALATGSPAVRTLFDTESRALFPEGFPGATAQRRDRAQDVLCFFGFGDQVKAVNDQVDNPFGDASGSTSCQPPRPPYDPNDKLADSNLLCEFGTVTVGGQPETRCVRYFVPRAQATAPVAYTITFENQATAGAPAEFVTITDDIDPAFDISTLRIESTSSDSTFSYSVSGRTVTFRFVGINLPPNVTAPEGEGFVRYSVRPAAGLPDGTEIRNTAGIVFDFNPAIATPEVLHEIRTVADVAAVITAPDFIVVGNAAPITVTVVNFRGDAATAAAVTIVTGGAAAQVTPSSGSCTGAGPFVCSFGDLAAGESVTVDVAFASAPAGTALTVSATATTTAFDGFAANDTDLVSVGVATVGTETDPDLPRELTLSSPRPNPARGATTLRWGLPAASSVDIRVYDLLGREVARIADGEAQEAGWHEARWEAQVASGVYVVRVRVGDEVRTRRMTVIR